MATRCSVGGHQLVYLSSVGHLNLKMATRSKDKCLELLSESFGPQHLEISGTKLPTYKQVLLCMLSHMNRLSGGDKFRQKKIKRKAAIAVQEQVSFHY